MPGDGTKPATMSAEAPVRLLDITRLVARAGAGPLTGIDRVERAYVRALIAQNRSFAMICRTALGYLILGSNCAPRLLTWVDDSSTIPPTSVFSRTLAHNRRTPALEAALRPHALAKVRPSHLADWLVGQFSAGISYLNVGHSNLTDRMLGQLRQVSGMRIAVMIHDTIPLDFPQYSGGRAPTEFREKLAAAMRHADLLLCTSAAVEADVLRWAGVLGTRAPTKVAHLGIETAAPDAAAIPRALNLKRPYFVTLGTIEPRKDHTLLLDIWADFHATLPPEEIPQLFIVGRRGWRNEMVFRRLDSEPFMGKSVFEVANLTDGAVTAMLQNACGLLAPSHAEGFGLPAAEAAALGVPVLASDLPVTREVLGSYPIYALPGDLSAWGSGIRTLTLLAKSPRLRPVPAKVPDWTRHFNLVFNWV